MTGVTADPSEEKPASYKAIGVSLAVASGVFIGVSFVLKKKGLLAANEKDKQEAGEGYGYLKNVWWWTGMILMIIGEVCNFCAYAFTEAMLVTPLGALSVVITAVLSSVFLKERLSFVGKVGCFMCVVGSVVIVMNAPEQTAVNKIQDMQKFVVTPGFLTYMGVVIVGCAFVAFWVAPRWGKQNMMVYISICSLIGGLSVVATQGLGAAVLAEADRGIKQFNQWFLYVVLVFVIATLLIEIIYLNKALNLFNTAKVTPTYYVCFTSSTIVTSAILFQGFKGTPTSIVTVVMGFLQICSGVVLLQLSKSAKDVPDAAVFTGDIDQIETIAQQHEPESEPKADSIRGAASIIRRISEARRHAEVDEAKRIRHDLRTPSTTGESVEWDGVRRRVTFAGDNPRRRNTLSGQHPLNLTHTPAIPEEPIADPRRRSMSVDEALRRPPPPDLENQLPPHHDGFFSTIRQIFTPRPRTASPQPDLPPAPPLSPPPRRIRTDYVPVAETPDDDDNATPRAAKRQFSFQRVLNAASPVVEQRRAHARGSASRSEEEMLGLVKGGMEVPATESSSDDYTSSSEEEEVRGRAWGKEGR